MTGYEMNDCGSIHGKGRDFSFLCPRPVLRFTHPFIQCIVGAPSPGVKQLGGEDDYSLPSGAEV
jgi:hypothetical protein